MCNPSLERLLDAACAAALQQAVVGFGVYDTDTLQAVLQFPESAAGFARALCTALRAEGPSCSSTGTVTDTVVLDVATQTALTGDVVDISTAEEMVEEALCMVVQAEERERLLPLAPFLTSADRRTVRNSVQF